MNGLYLIPQIILTGGLVALAIRQHFIYEGQKKRDAEEDERMALREQKLLELLGEWELLEARREWNLERWRAEEREQERWAFVRAYCPELEASMAEPTVGELKRALALPQHQNLRERCMDWVNTAPPTTEPILVSRFYCALFTLRSLEDSDGLPKEISGFSLDEYFMYGKHTGAHQTWLKEMAREADRNFHADAMDAALPPPASAAPSTRGRL